MWKIGKILIVLSGKGGVGKSSISTAIAVSLALRGERVGLLDIDLCGPSIPRMCCVNTPEHRIMQSSQGWIPVLYPSLPNLKIMSIGFLLDNSDDSIVWRGPKKTAMITQFLTSVDWGDLDYLIIDTPPGTSDEHLAVVETLQTRCMGNFSSVGALMATTPQWVALSDVRKEIQFCRHVQLPILGLIENMSGFVCPHCEHCSPIFSSMGGQSLASQENIPFLGTLPIDPGFSSALEGNLDNPLHIYLQNNPLPFIENI